MMQCAICGHELKEGKTIKTYHKNGYVLVVKNVPGLICETCGEVELSGPVFERLGMIFQAWESGIPGDVITEYKEAAA